MINITRRGWNHILKYHTGPQFTARKSMSKFYGTVNLISLIYAANSHAP